MVYDPWANSDIVCREYGIEVTDKLPSGTFDACIAAVAHQKFVGLDIQSLLKPNHIIFDVKSTINREIIDGRL